MNETDILTPWITFNGNEKAVKLCCALPIDTSDFVLGSKYSEITETRFVKCIQRAAAPSTRQSRHVHRIKLYL